MMIAAYLCGVSDVDVSLIKSESHFVRKENSFSERFLSFLSYPTQEASHHICLKFQLAKRKIAKAITYNLYGDLKFKVSWFMKNAVKNTYKLKDYRK